jgi:hypothetical protein
MTPLQAAECAREDARAAVDAMHDLVRTAVEEATAAKERADKLAQLLTPTAHIAVAYLDRVHQPDLRDEAHALLEAIRKL